jgi:hypothetical protein
MYELNQKLLANELMVLSRNETILLQIRNFNNLIKI